MLQHTRMMRESCPISKPSNDVLQHIVEYVGDKHIDLLQSHLDLFDTVESIVRQRNIGQRREFHGINYLH